MEQLNRRERKRDCLCLQWIGGTSLLYVFGLSVLIVLVNSLLTNQSKNWHVSACDSCNSRVDVPSFREIFDTFLTNMVFKVVQIVEKD